VEVTLAELERAVSAEIQRAGIRQGNGQVSPAPDRRTLRYYTSIGLVDRPLAIRDRQAVYGERHVLQAVAVKRLQAAGLSLGQIQTRLTGLPTAQLAAIADRPASADPGAEQGGGRRRWWAAPAAAAEAASWRPAPLPAPSPVPSPVPDDDPATLTAVALGANATLLVPASRPLGPADVAAIREAAAPLITHLAEAGLTHPKDRP
jgi:DNA-binding transcriptional MerR regulator